MNGYKENGNEIQLDKRETVGYVPGYTLKETGNAEQDEAPPTTSNSGSKENIFNTLTEPEDWERGYN